MTPIEALERALRERVPGLRSELDRPAYPSGTWWLEASRGKRSVTIEWRRRGGFGLSSSEVEGFEGSDERHATARTALPRAIELLRTGEKTRPPHVATLPELRAGRPQEVVARKLGVKQAQVSKFERQPNMRLMTLKKYIAALGGRMEIRARFEGEVGDVIVSGPWNRARAKKVRKAR